MIQGKKRARTVSGVEAQPTPDVDLRDVDAHFHETNLEASDRRFRELYQKPADFRELAQLDPDFASM